MRRNERLSKIYTFLAVILGNGIYALSVKLFLEPVGLIDGGVTGIGLIVRHYFGINLSVTVMILNISLLILAYFTMGRKFVAASIVGSLSYPILLEVCDRVFGDLVLTEDIMLCTVFLGLGIGLSLGIMIRAGASSGGMDIPPIIIHKYFNVPVSVTMYLLDVLILLGQAIYNDIEIILYGIVLILIYTIAMNKLLLMGSQKTEVQIISDHADAIREAILSEVDRGVTMLHGQTGFLQKDTKVVLSIISNKELPMIERLAHDIDPDSFMIVSRVTEVRGRGFSSKKKYEKREIS